MKKIITISMLIFCILFCVTMKTDAKTTSKNWYKKVLSNSSSTFSIGKKKYRSGNYAYHKVIDINKDGTKELILAKSRGPFLPGYSSAVLLTYHKNKIKAVKKFHFDGGYSLGYNSKKKTIVFFKRDSGSSSYTSFQLKKGKLVKKEQTAYKRIVNDHYPYYTYIYKINGKTTTQRKWQSYSKKMWGKSISYN